jgi:carbon monoxide dehydrogenase subunit G
MQLEHEFTVPRPAEEVFAVLRDVERIAPCMPGASIDNVDGDEFAGKVKVKVGPMQLTYSGTARFVEVDEEARRATLEATGKEIRGAGQASAKVNTVLTEVDGETHVKVVTDLSITGRPAQFGRGVMADVGDKLLGQFADCLAAEMEQGMAPPPEAGPGEPGEVIDLSERRPTAEAIDLMDIAGGAVLRRVVPVVAGAALLALIVWLARRALR